MSRKKIDIKDKKLFLNFVYLAAEEYSSLCELFGKKEADEWIEELNGSIGQHGYKYESHYWTIRNWVRLKAKKSSELNGRPIMRNPEHAALRESARVLEALLDPAQSKYMPAFEEKAKAALYTVLKSRQMTWSDLHRYIRMSGNPNSKDIFCTEFEREYK